MRAVLVDKSGNVVQAVVLAPDWTPQSTDWQPPVGQTVVLDDNAGIGWTYDGKTFTPPPQPPPVIAPPMPPDPVVALQAALIAKGVITQADVTAAAAALAAAPVGT